ncbi:MAG: hypothetical protein HYX60_10300 [Legionella longbeachae]|nr:hypothetical protein [Legionella longbeachae]
MMDMALNGSGIRDTARVSEQLSIILKNASNLLNVGFIIKQ